jgi:flagellar biosynthesis protein FlhF
MNIANESRHFLKLALEHIAESFFSFASFSTMPRRLMLVGAPGIGKTLTIAKLATRYALAKEKIVVITTDMNRAGGADQLRSFTDILNVPLSVCPDKKALSDALKLAGKDAHILIDTAGCNPYIDEEIANISELTRAGDIGCALVMQAGLDAQEALEITEAFTNLPISRLIGTRMDCTKRYGGLVAAAAGHGLPFAFASDSPSVADNITELTPKTLVQYLFKPDR